jgi:hypothetical protein
MDQDFTDGFNASQAGQPRDDQQPAQWLAGYDHSEEGGILRTTEYLNDR